MNQEVQGNVLPVGNEAELDLSVVCPFYNEEQIIGDAIRLLLKRLENIDASWELIVVNDGCKDRSGEIAAEIARDEPRLRVLSYEYNRGRGYALRTGIAQARGAVIVTTEIDLSWGEDIVERLYAAKLAEPDTDIVIASPHLKPGHYKNVPLNRVLFSVVGNKVIRACMKNVATMNTGMTRAYRREIIRSLPLHENRKEFHLEVVLKATVLGYRISEIPAVLEWKDYKHKGREVKRKSSTDVNKLVISHSLYSLFANPIRPTWGLSFFTMLGAVGCLLFGVARLFLEGEAFPWILTGLLLATIALLLFAFGLIAQQGNMIQQEIWRMKQDFTVLKLRQTGGDQFPAERDRRRGGRTEAREKELEAADGPR